MRVAFKLYDTYGFPLDLTQDALRMRKIAVDLPGFDQAMAKQKSDARAAWSGSGDASTETHWFGVKERVGATEFLGYATERVEAEVVALVKDGAQVQQAEAGERVQVILNQTPFLRRVRRTGRRHRRDAEQDRGDRDRLDGQEARRPLRPRWHGH